MIFGVSREDPIPQASRTIRGLIMFLVAAYRGRGCRAKALALPVDYGMNGCFQGVVWGTELTITNRFTRAVRKAKVPMECAVDF